MKFSKKDADKYRQLFYDIDNCIHLAEIKIEEARKNFNKLEKSLNLKSFVILMLLIMKMIKSLMCKMLMC